MVFYPINSDCSEGIEYYFSLNHIMYLIQQFHITGSISVFYNFNATFTLLLLFKVHNCTPARPDYIGTGRSGPGVR